MSHEASLLINSLRVTDFLSLPCMAGILVSIHPLSSPKVRLITIVRLVVHPSANSSEFENDVLYQRVVTFFLASLISSSKLDVTTVEPTLCSDSDSEAAVLRLSYIGNSMLSPDSHSTL